MPITDLVFVDADGYHYPDFDTVFQRTQDDYRAIYGPDVNLDPDTQDGAWIANQSQQQFDAAQNGAAIYNSFSPYTAQADGLTRNVKINGIFRAVPSFSQADVDIVGVAGTTINNGQAQDTLGQKWDLPAVVVIPLSGTITVTVLADKQGEIPAQANTITKIATPTAGWQTITNPLPAIAGNPVESDAALRQRQTTSTSIPSLTVLEGIVGAVAAVPGVVKYRGYENDTSMTTLEGIPAYSIAIVAEGGAAQEIGTAIFSKKTAGTPTFGSTSVIVTDSLGIQTTINFSRPPPAIIGVNIVLEALPGYLDTTGDDIKLAVVDYISSLMIGEDIYVSKLYVPANLDNMEASNTFNIISIEANKDAGPFVTNVVDLNFDEDPVSTIGDVDVTAI